MALDDYVPDGFDLNEEDKRLVREFKLQEPEAAMQSVVYGIFDNKTGELLYIGETKALIRRISDHFRTRDSKNILGLVENDSSIDIQGGREGNIWERTAIKYIKVTGSRQRRRKLESALERDLEPRYPSG
jgi:excinuclease UvrABC nuclease subunit